MPIANQDFYFSHRYDPLLCLDFGLCPQWRYATTESMPWAIYLARLFCDSLSRGQDVNIIYYLSFAINQISTLGPKLWH